MTSCGFFAKRFITAAATLAVAVLGGAAFGSRTAGAAPPPLTIELGVSPGGTEATVYVRPTNPELITVSHTLRRVAATGPVGPTAPPTRLPVRDVAAPLGGGVFSDGSPPPVPVYEKEARIRLTGLQPNTTYEVLVNAGTSDGRTATARQTFSTLKQRVRLTLDKIVVHDDGDGFLSGKGEPTWLWTVEGFAGGPLKDCYPKNSAGRCGVAEVSEGTLYPYFGTQKYVLVFAQENFVPVVNPNQQPGDEDFTSMPQQFTLRADATEDDPSIVGSVDGALSTIFGDWGAWLAGSSVATWQAPHGVELASQQVTVAANDGTFESTLYFTFQLFHDNQTYSPNDGRVHSTSK